METPRYLSRSLLNSVRSFFDKRDKSARKNGAGLTPEPELPPSQETIDAFATSFYTAARSLLNDIPVALPEVYDIRTFDELEFFADQFSHHTTRIFLNEHNSHIVQKELGMFSADEATALRRSLPSADISYTQRQQTLSRNARIMAQNVFYIELLNSNPDFEIYEAQRFLENARNPQADYHLSFDLLLRGLGK